MQALYQHRTLRLGDRLKVSWDVETSPREAEMPLLLIEPLIENAVYHGIQPLSEGGLFTLISFSMRVR
jgi:two-component system sensor histidine kinase AlgZ